MLPTTILGKEKNVDKTYLPICHQEYNSRNTVTNDVAETYIYNLLNDIL